MGKASSNKRRRLIEEGHWSVERLFSHLSGRRLTARQVRHEVNTGELHLDDVLEISAPVKGTVLVKEVVMLLEDDADRSRLADITKRGSCDRTGGINLTETRSAKATSESVDRDADSAGEQENYSRSRRLGARLWEWLPFIFYGAVALVLLILMGRTSPGLLVGFLLINGLIWLYVDAETKWPKLATAMQVGAAILLATFVLLGLVGSIANPSECGRGAARLGMCD